MPLMEGFDGNFQSTFRSRLTGPGEGSNVLRYYRDYHFIYYAFGAKKVAAGDRAEAGE